MRRVLTVTCFTLVLIAPPVIAQDRVDAKPERAQIQKVGDVTLKRGLLARPENSAKEARVLLNQMRAASAELAAAAHLRTMQRDLDMAIEQWEEKLSSAGDDAQLSNIELQNMLQKQQQTLQTMSNVSKMMHDTAMAIIRKIG